MTILRYPRDQFIESVIECLDIAEVSINLWKPDGSGIFGYPAALLLLCVIDAMGHNFPKPEREKLGIDFPLGMLAFPSSGFNVSRDQIRNIYDWYRNKLAHLGLIARDAILRGEDGDQMFDVTPDGEINTIFVVPFYRKVRQLWETIDKSLFESRDIEGPAARENSLARAIQSLSSTINDKGTPTPAASGTFIQV